MPFCRRRAEARTRPTPKALTKGPDLYEVPPGGEGAIGDLRRLTAERRAGNGAERPSSLGTAGETDEDADLIAPTLELLPPDASIAAQARSIVSRLAFRPPPPAARGRSGTPPRSRPYRGESDELDLERTVEVLAEKRALAAADVVVRERTAGKRSVLLLADVSGSMRGERLLTSAAAVGALSWQLAREDFGLLAFWSDAALLAPLGSKAAPTQLAEAIARLRGRGLTNVAFPLEVAARQLAGRPPELARAVLLSDCVHNAGPDPVPLARRLHQLDVLLDVSGEHDRDLAERLSHAGRGTLQAVRGHRDVAPALNRAFAA